MPADSVNFDRAANYYDETRGFPAGENVNVAQFIADIGGLTSQSTVLEIGIGTGRIAFPLSHHTGRYFGIDISARMLKKLHDKQTGESVLITQGDVLTLPFANNSFDAVIIVHVLHLVADGIQVLREVRRVLKPDGSVLKCQNSFGNVDDPIKPIREAWMSATESHRKARDRWYTIDDVLITHGFSTVKPRQVYAYKSETTPAHFLERIQKRQWSNTWSMPDDIWQAGVDSVKNAITTHFDGDEHTIINQQAGFEVEVFQYQDDKNA